MLKFRTHSYGKVEEKFISEEKQLVILLDPDKCNQFEVEGFLKKIPPQTTHIFVGGSRVSGNKTESLVKNIKQNSRLPVVLFPGDHSQITEAADALLFLSLLSGRNPEYLIEQQVRSVTQLKTSNLEIIPTGYILIDGGHTSSVQRVSNTKPIAQNNIEIIVNTALAGQFSGKKLIYLEAGSGAKVPVSKEIIREVKKAISIPLIVGGGIASAEKMENAYSAGANIVVIGNAFENDQFRP